MQLNKSSVKGTLPLRSKILYSIFIIVVIGSGYVLVNRCKTKHAQEKTALQNQAAQFNKKLDTLQKDMQILKEERPAGADAFSVSQIKDVYFLARIAQDRLQNYDITAAKQLLQLAQEHLLTLHDDKLVNAKAVLSADIAKLHAVNYPDINAVQGKIAVLDKLITVMPLKAEEPDAQAATTVFGDTKTDATEQQPLIRVVKEVKSLIKIKRKSTRDTEAMYANPDLNRSRFRLLVEQIRWAAFYKDVAVYQKSIKQAQELIPHVYDAKNTDVQKFVDTLKELAQIQIKPDLPSIQDFINAVQAFLVG